MSERYKAYVKGVPYFVTLTAFAWIDIFTRPEYKQILIEGLEWQQKKNGLKIHAFVIMTNHVHAILSADDKPLGGIIRDFKSFTNKKIIEQFKSCETKESRRAWMMSLWEKESRRLKRSRYFKVWKDGFHPVLLSDDRMIGQRLNYIHQNPVKEEWVFEASHYPWSSANYYDEGGASKLEIERLA